MVSSQNGRDTGQNPNTTIVSIRLPCMDRHRPGSPTLSDYMEWMAILVRKGDHTYDESHDILYTTIDQ